MPLAADLRDLLKDPSFWSAYERSDGDDGADDERWEDHPGWTLTADVGGGHTLVLEIDIELGMVNLGVCPPGVTEPLQLGWDDDAHPFPHALRWDELDLIARAVALRDPDLPHPGPLLALVSRFVLLGEHDDLDAVTPLLAAAFGTGPADAAYWPTARSWLYRCDGRGRGVTWQRDDAGNWTVDQDEDQSGDFTLYSLRGPESEFPFDAWRELLAAAGRTVSDAVPGPARDALGDLPARAVADRDLSLAGQTGRSLAAAGVGHPVILRGLDGPTDPAEVCWILETVTGAAQGSLVARWFGPSALRVARRYRLDLHLEVGGRPDPRGYASTVTRDLDRALRDRGLGHAEQTGSSMRRDASGGYVTHAVSVDIAVFDDLAAGTDLVRHTLLRHDPAPETVLRHQGGTDAVVALR
ncbi:hypothetical protein [Micromonospora antibiotica]|uniref:DUF695 domain-containing protein n=1 Tax=Micromonospora antibiotica TaxID=2807623 RepID=A0ABS3VH98_9ACTN|nr:hypothetical protein [Micromonospora antibiotica]MBO4165013.1 hypothetical protein [Micromonospora antibiotica]